MSSVRRPTPREWTLLQSFILCALGLWIFLPALNGDWIWDDAMLITQNPQMRSGVGLGQIWFAPPVTDYWPVTWTLLWCEWHLWGAHPLGFHLVSLALHLISAFLIWSLFTRLGLRSGWLGALLFVVHPLSVESVAWSSEIKNTLSLPFFLLAVHAHIDARENEISRGHLRAFLFFVIATLCKSSVIMLPFVLLLYDWWRNGRLLAVHIVRMIPYFAVALALGLITIHFQTRHYAEIEVVAHRTIFERIVGAGVATFFYLGKFAFPVDLLPIYPRWNLSPPSPLQIMTLPLLALTLAAFWTHRQTWGRHAILSTGFFLINLVPVIGLLRMTWMNISWVADHLVYLPMIGLIGCTVAGLEAMERKASRAGRLYLVAAIAALVVLMIAESHAYAGRFASIQALMTLNAR